MTNPFRNILLFLFLVEKAFSSVFGQQPLNMVDFLFLFSLVKLFINSLFTNIHFIVMSHIKIIRPYKRKSLEVSSCLLI